MSQPIEPESFDRHEEVRVREESDALELHSQEPGGFAKRERGVQDLAAERRLRLSRITDLVWLLTGFLEGLIAIRILLKLIGANPQNPFAGFVYAVTGFFLAPFFGLVANPAGYGIVFEVTSIVGMLFYALLAWAVVKLIWVALDPTSARGVSTYDRERR